jgi:hypothetical protein
MNNQQAADWFKRQLQVEDSHNEITGNWLLTSKQREAYRRAWFALMGRGCVENPQGSVAVDVEVAE